MFKFRYATKETIPFQYRDDCERIARILGERLPGDMGVSLYSCYKMWEEYSDSSCAGWLMVETYSDEEIFRILIDEGEDD